jgi:hypothetical protein
MLNKMPILLKCVADIVMLAVIAIQKQKKI